MKKTNIDIVFEICQKQMPEDLEYKSRKRQYLYQRWIFWQILQDLNLGYTLTTMAKHLGYDHATVLHAKGRFFLDIPGEPYYMDLYNECLKLSMNRLNIKNDVIKSKMKSDSLIDKIVDIKAELMELEKEKKALQIKLRIPKSKVKDKFMEEILTLNEDQYRSFKERASIMLKSIKTIRTYENTHKREFNAA